ncbi:MAG: hypothetical protein GY948_00325 [Alphaproteobacteria bacterium]|nr:hypothetical protein [Alphaproteobacteria bacterium]
MFIVSEISPQFGNDLDIAEQMILESKMGGANAAKLQLYPAEMFSPEPVDPYVKSRELSFDDFKRLKTYGDKIGLPVFATAFDEERLGWCLDVDQAYYKIAARQHKENPALVDKITSMGKTVFVSVPHDYDVASVDVREGCIYLHCIVQYPTLLEDVSVPTFHDTIFEGISDHSLGIAAALIAAARGAKYLEKHYTINYAWQRSNEKAHLGAMTLEDLRTIKRISSDMERILAAD